LLLLVEERQTMFDVVPDLMSADDLARVDRLGDLVEVHADRPPLSDEFENVVPERLVDRRAEVGRRPDEPTDAGAERDLLFVAKRLEPLVLIRPRLSRLPDKRLSTPRQAKCLIPNIGRLTSTS
jgi:hypothetical protein